MKALDQIKISFYKDVFSKRPQEVPLLMVLEAIIMGKYADQINTIRRYHEQGDKDTAQQLKSKLPCFTASGTFSGGHSIKNLLLHSGIISLDYDHVKNRPYILMLCAADSHTVAAFESPTDGLKILVYVENITGRHREGVQMASQYYDNLLDLQCDPACKDESRLNYVSYSPKGYIAALYEAFRLPDSEPNPGRNEIPINEIIIVEAAPIDGKAFVASYFFLNAPVENKRNTTLFKLACEACKRGYEQNAIFGEVSTYFENTNFTKEEIHRTLSSGYKHINNNSKATDPPVNSFKRQDENAKASKSRYSAVEGDETLEETYWQGEELRKKTPFFPELVYDNLPELLESCIIEDITLRERDALLLSCITTLSAILPNTYGIYDKKRFSPHLFCVITAPAGSGKSIVQLGRCLMDTIHERILNESNSALKSFKAQRAGWLAKCTQNLKEKIKTDYAEEPQEPPFRMLIIPATTSYTRMQIQLRDNGALGGIIFDTEAQTLSTANKMDCGNFDDMLRKAFGHENIDSSYKANGMKPIIIRRPSLALLLTGTPAQLSDLFYSSENGLISRILIYTYREAPIWKQMGNENIASEDLFSPLADQAHALYSFCEKNPVQFFFTKRQWSVLNDVFGRLLTDVVTDGNDDLQAVVKRYAFLVMRISMVLTRLKQFAKKDISMEVHCDDTDFEKALSIVRCCYNHSRLLLMSMPPKGVTALKNPDSIRDFINQLPETFTTEEAQALAESHEFSPRKVTRILKELTGVKINKLSHGKYQKTST